MGGEMTSMTWQSLLDGRIDPAWAEEIDAFEAQLLLRQQGKIEERVCAETRLRRGVYGQRYDNGHRYDGYGTRELAFPDVPKKGPETMWDAARAARRHRHHTGAAPFL